MPDLPRGRDAAASIRRPIAGLSALISALLFGLSLLVCALPAVAQESGGSGEPAYGAGVDAENYQPVSPAQRTETVSASLMVTLAYVLMWLAVVVFLLAMLRRSRALRADVAAARAQLEALDQRIARLGDRGEGGP